MTIDAPEREHSSAVPRPVDFGDRHAVRRRRMKVALVVLAVVLTAFTVWLVWFSSVLAVKSVRVVGVEGDRAGEVLRSAAVPVGVPLARIDTSTSQAAVAGLPWIGSVDVRRGWPNEVVVAVQPRVAIAVLVGSDGDRKVVDVDGVAFTASKADTDGLPVIKADGPGVETATAVLASLPPQLARATVSLSAASRDDVDLRLR